LSLFFFLAHARHAIDDLGQLRSYAYGGATLSSIPLRDGYMHHGTPYVG
jgi:hypothetical protein